VPLLRHGMLPPDSATLHPGYLFGFGYAGLVTYQSNDVKK